MAVPKNVKKLKEISISDSEIKQHPPRKLKKAISVKQAWLSRGVKSS